MIFGSLVPFKISSETDPLGCPTIHTLFRPSVRDFRLSVDLFATMCSYTLCFWSRPLNKSSNRSSPIGLQVVAIDLLLWDVDEWLEVPARHRTGAELTTVIYAAGVEQLGRD